MAGFLTADDVDFKAYMRDTDCKVRVRPARDFEFDLIEANKPRPPGYRAPSMFSSQLGRKLEFRPGEVTLWAGYSKHRKSTFTGQVMAELGHQGQRVLISSFEMDPWVTLNRMARQVTGLHSLSPDRVRQFMRWSDGKLWMFDHRGRISPEFMLAVLNYFAEEHKGTQAVIDSFQFVCASEESIDEQKQFMTDLVRVSQETGLHIHLLAHCRKPSDGSERNPPTKHDIRGTASLVDQASNIVTIWFDRERAAKLERHPSDEEWLAKPAAKITVEGQRNAPFEGRLDYWQCATSGRFTDERTTIVEAWDAERDEELF